jgi:hypothetical protein
MAEKKQGRPKKYKVAKENAVHDGKGGFLEKGDELPEGCDVDSLVDKGLAS